MRKTVSVAMLFLLVITTFAVSLKIQTVKSQLGTYIAINADGSISPPTASVNTLDNATYVLVGNLNEGIVVQRSNIVIDGNGHTLYDFQLGSRYAFYLSGVNNVTIKNATISDFLEGIYFNSSSNNTLSNIVMVGNVYNNFGITGTALNDFIHTIDTSNLVEGKPIYYLVNQSNLVISPESYPEIGYLGLVSCTNITVQNSTLSGDRQGILLAYTNDSQIVNNNIVSNKYGISLTSCFGNNVSSNIGTSNDFGIALYNSCNNVLSDNRFDSGYLRARALDGALLYFSNNNTLSGNYVSGYAQVYKIEEYATNYSIVGGFELSSSDYNKLVGNDVTGNGQGISLESSDNNILIANSVTGSVGYAGGAQIEAPWGFGIRIDSSSNNAIYHNNFIGNFVYELYCNSIIENNVMSDGSPNMWDDGYPSGGNYWSDYNGTDANHDGIGHTPYTIDANNTDYFPLMGMFSSFSTLQGYPVNMISNSTISGFAAPIWLEHPEIVTLMFNVTGTNGSTGFCRVSFPTAMMNGTYHVSVNGTEVPYILLPSSNANVSYLYFTYKHSTEQVIIFPEFPSFLILPLMIMATLLAVIIYKKKGVKTSQSWIEPKENAITNHLSKRRNL